MKISDLRSLLSSHTSIFRHLLPVAQVGSLTRSSTIPQMPFQTQTMLPPETWGTVLGFLPKSSQLTLLFVSQYLHDLALRVLFAHVTIRFGLWRMGSGVWDEVAEETEWGTPEYTRESDENKRRTSTLLAHITRTQTFANLVKKISVRAYSWDNTNDDQCQFYILCLFYSH